MQQHEIDKFLLQYFQANNCEIIEETDSYVTVQLTAELDKLLMNRPFYWHYVEKMNKTPEPYQLTFITNFKEGETDKQGEYVSFGSPFLHKLFSSAKDLGSHIRLYEDGSFGDKTALYPWLGLNLKVSYECDLKKDKFLSIGLQLINGQIYNNFYDYVVSLSMTPKIPDYCFTLSPLIMPKSGLRRIENYIRLQLEAEDHLWAEEAIERWDNDLQLLNNFFANMTDEDGTYENEKEALRKQYEPLITVSIINGGLFYLRDNFINKGVEH